MAVCLNDMRAFLSQTSASDAETLAAMAVSYGIVGVIGLISNVALYLLLTPVWFRILGLGKAVYEPAKPAAIADPPAGPASELSSPYTAR